MSKYTPKSRIVNSKKQVVRVDKFTGKHRIAIPSFKEKEIIKFLKSEYVSYVREYPVTITVNKRTYSLYFDFYLPAMDILIEYDGRHHKEAIYGAKELEKTKKHDAYKNMWAVKNKKHLLRLDKNSDIPIDICNFLDKVCPL